MKKTISLFNGILKFIGSLLTVDSRQLMVYRWPLADGRIELKEG